MSTCIPEVSYFGTPEFLTFASHIITAIETPVNLFGAWIILFRTPVTMSSVKWPMLNLHFWSSFLDFSISFLMVPFVLFPDTAGYPLGFLRYLGVGTGYQIHFGVTLIGIVTISILAVYENRYFMVAPNNGLSKRISLIFLGTCYFLCLTFMIPFTFMIPDQEKAVKAVFEQLPCLPDYVYRSPVFVYAVNMLPVFSTTASLFILAVTGILVYISLTISSLLRKTRQLALSSKTLNLQKKFLFSLVVQTSIPVLVLFCPIGYLMVSMPQRYYNQAINNFVPITFSLHGILSTIGMLTVHKHYRDATLAVFFPRFGVRVVEEKVNTTIVPARKTTGKVECVAN